MGTHSGQWKEAYFSLRPLKLNYTLGKKAIRRMRRGNLGIWPMIDGQNLPAIYFLHKKIRKIQHFADKILQCPRGHIRKKGNYYYIKAFKYYLKRWLKYVKENPEWKRHW